MRAWVMPSKQCVIQSLEPRRMLSSTPASPRPNSLGALFDKNERQTILDRMDNLASGTKSNLQSKLNTSVSAFDTALQNYMLGRSTAKFFFNSTTAPDDGSYIVTNHVSYSDIVSR